MKLYQAVHRLKLQAGSTGASENNANVPVLVEVWQVLVQMVWGNARVHSRGSKYGGKHFLCKPRIVLVKWARQQNCPLISYKSGLHATARHLNQVELFKFLLRPSLLEMCQYNSIYKCFNFSIKGSFIKLEMFQRLPYLTVGGKKWVKILDTHFSWRWVVLWGLHCTDSIYISNAAGKRWGARSQVDCMEWHSAGERSANAMEVNRLSFKSNKPLWPG